MDLIIIILIIFWIYKKNQKNSAAFTNTVFSTQIRSRTLDLNLFNNLNSLERQKDRELLAGSLNGDNYLILVMKNNASVYSSTITSLTTYAQKEHYHNIILVAPQASISNTARPAIKNANIQVWNSINTAKTSTQHASTPTTSVSAVIKTSEIHDTCKIASSEDPIQDGRKANSLLGNLFHNNKIERL